MIVCYDYKDYNICIVLIINKYSIDIQWHKWTLDNLYALILTISKYGSEYVHSLTRAFYLFDPVSMSFCTTSDHFKVTLTHIQEDVLTQQ